MHSLVDGYLTNQFRPTNDGKRLQLTAYKEIVDYIIQAEKAGVIKINVGQLFKQLDDKIFEADEFKNDDITRAFKNMGLNKSAFDNVKNMRARNLRGDLRKFIDEQVGAGNIELSVANQTAFYMGLNSTVEKFFGQDTLVR